MLALLASCVSPPCPEGWVRQGDVCEAEGASDGGVDAAMRPDGGPRDAGGSPDDGDASRDVAGDAPDAPVCSAPFLDCTSARGCETDIRVAREHCGECGHRCAWGCRDSQCDDAVEISVGDQFACARRVFGSVVCWGRNEYGQLGDGSRTDRWTPVAVRDIDDAVELTAGDSHACVRRRDGAVWCWGYNGPGQLGRSSAYEVRPVEALPASAGAVEIGAGRGHTCARTAEGQVWCWGSDSEGQLGTGSFGSTHVGAQRVVGLDDAVEIALGARHTCARRATGLVVCWGFNSGGQLGDGTVLRRNTASIEIEGLDAVRLSAGTSHTCAIDRSGGLWCWGSNFYGQLGIGTAPPAFTPAQLSLVGVSQVAASHASTCAIAGEELRCWGAPEWGQLGTRQAFDFATPTGPSIVDGAVEVSARGFGACARVAGGTVRCWGANDVGQVGDGRTDERGRYEPSPVSAPLSAGE